jgi:hypothetical protein
MSSYGPYTGDAYEGSLEESHDMEAEAAAAFAESMEAENVNAITEQDERIIYEWVIPKLKGSVLVNGSPWELKHTAKRITALWDDGVNLRVTSLSPLDMNFAFDVCIPKLNAASVSVTFTNFDDAGRWHLLDVVCDAECRNTTASVDYEGADFYSALLAYIKGNPNV